MVTVRDRIFIRYDNGVCYERVELEIDSAEELPEADFITGYSLYQGSLAHDISTGQFYALDSTGTWYAQDGSGAYTPPEEDDDVETL